MAVRLGIAPIGWTNDDLPELGGHISLDQCLREASQAGFTGIEKSGRFPLEANVLRPLLDEHELSLVSGWFSGLLLNTTIDDEKSRIGTQLELFLEFECPVMVYAETTGTVQANRNKPVAERPKLDSDTIRRYGEKLSKFADWLQAEGCPMSYHYHMGTVIEQPDEIDLLLGNTDTSVGLLLDTGHLAFAGGDILSTTRAHASRINHIHCKNIRSEIRESAQNERLSFLDAVIEGVFTVPGDPSGSIDFRGFLKELKQLDYQGWIVVEAEQDPDKANPLEMAEIGYNELYDAANTCGFTIV
ncbi:MAG: myo-inosose-2 dehydratase [Pseudomonadota bacterium]